jgi:hypothetical protein
VIERRVARPQALDGVLREEKVALAAEWLDACEALEAATA